MPTDKSREALLAQIKAEPQNGARTRKTERRHVRANFGALTGEKQPNQPRVMGAGVRHHGEGAQPVEIYGDAQPPRNDKAPSVVEENVIAED